MKKNYYFVTWWIGEIGMTIFMPGKPDIQMDIVDVGITFAEIACLVVYIPRSWIYS